MLNQAQHRTTMFQILNAIYSEPKLRNLLAFKGWTLCYFLYNLPRFSTDLDFDLVWNEKTEFSAEHMQILQTILKKFGTIKDEKDKRFTYFFLLSYQDGQRSIKIELSKKQYKHTTYEQKNFFGKNILAMSKQSIFAHKLVALSERWKNRDVFDVHFFFKNNFPLDPAIITERTGKTPAEFFTDIHDQLPKHFSSTTILAEIGDLINEKQKYFMKHHIVKEVQSFLQFTAFSTKNT